MYVDAIWSNRVLIPLWTAHLTFLLLVIGVLAVDMMEYAGDNDGKNSSVLTAFMTFFCIAIIMSPLEMILKSFRLLEPWLYLSFQAYKTLFGLVFAIVQIVAYVRTDWASFAGWIKIVMLVLIVVTILMTLSFVASLIYGSVVLHRHRKRPEYDFVKERDNEDNESMDSRPSSMLMASGAVR